MNRENKVLTATALTLCAVAVWLWLRGKKWTWGGLFSGTGNATGTGAQDSKTNGGGVWCPVCKGYFDTIHVHLD